MEKLNLSKKVVDRFWEQKNHNFFQIFKMLEENEYWCVDETKEVNTALLELSDLLTEASISAKDVMEQSNTLIFVMAYIKFSKALRIVNFFDEKYKEELSQALVIEAVKNKDKSYYRLLLDRLLFIRDFALLEKIYSRERVDKVKNILNKFKQEELK